MSTPNYIFPIEDFLAPCNNCPLYNICAKDAPQRLICATPSSPSQSPLTYDPPISHPYYRAKPCDA